MCLLTAFCVLVISDLLTNIPKRTNLDLAKWENGQRTFDLSFRRIHSFAKPPNVRVNWYFICVSWEANRSVMMGRMFCSLPACTSQKGFFYSLFFSLLSCRFKMIWKQKLTQFQHYFLNCRRQTDNCSVLLNSKQT